MYESGLLIALLLWLWLTITSIVALNSRMNRNLRKIGQRLSWLTMTPKPISREEVNHGFVRIGLKFVIVFGTGLPFIFASWLYVIYIVGILFYRKSKDSGAPQAVREFRWKLRNMDMTLDQIIKELMKVTDQDPNEFEAVKAEFVRELRDQGIVAG